jgi:vacuolar-type H+-ATPase subunit I/STV1
MNAIEIALYLGIFLMVFGFFLFLYSEMKIREADRELWKNEQLLKSFMKAKNDTH